MRILWSWQRWMHRPVEHLAAPPWRGPWRRRSRPGSGGVTSRPRSRRSVSSALTTVAFSVEPSTTPRGILVPSMLIPKRHDAEMLGEVDPVDHQRDQIQLGEIGVHHLVERPFGHGHEPATHRGTRRRRRGGLDRRRRPVPARPGSGGSRAWPSSAPARAHRAARSTRTAHTPAPPPRRCGPRCAPAGDAPAPDGRPSVTEPSSVP